MTGRPSINELTSDQLDALCTRLAAAEAVVRRIDQMAAAWEQRLPETIRTATAVEAIRMVTARAPEALQVDDGTKRATENPYTRPQTRREPANVASPAETPPPPSHANDTPQEGP